MKLELPLKDKRWRIPVQLATVSMLLTVAAIAAAGVWLLNLPLGAAVLLGAILAPTDPVLASDVQVASHSKHYAANLRHTWRMTMKPSIENRSSSNPAR